MDKYIHVGVRYTVGVNAVPVPRQDVQQVVSVEVESPAVALLSPQRRDEEKTDAHYPAVQLGAHVLRDRQKGYTLDLHNGMSSETQRARLPCG